VPYSLPPFADGFILQKEVSHKSDRKKKNQAAKMPPNNNIVTQVRRLRQHFFRQKNQFLQFALFFIVHFVQYSIL